MFPVPRPTRKFWGRLCTFFFFLAHLSRRLIGELIVYQWSGVRPSSVHPSIVRRRPQCSKIFFSETAGPIKAKFYVEPPWVGGTIFCSRHLGHMPKMAATPIYGKNPSKIFFSRTGGPIFTKLGIRDQEDRQFPVLYRFRIRQTDLFREIVKKSVRNFTFFR